APGTARFRLTVEEGRALVRALRGRLSGLAQPIYVLDIPGGAGKAPLGPDAWEEHGVRDFRGNFHSYPERPHRRFVDPGRRFKPWIRCDDPPRPTQGRLRMSIRAMLKVKGQRVVTAKSNTTIKEVVETLAREKIGAVVISDDDRTVAGILSERDIV